MFKNDDFLKDIDKEAQELINKQLAELDVVSENIRILEERLIHLSVPHTIIYSFNKEKQNFPQSQEPPFLTHYKEFSLAWMHDLVSRKFKIMYIVKMLVYEDEELKTSRTLFVRRLNETPIHTRLGIKNHLAPFYKKVLEEYKKMQASLVE